MADSTHRKQVEEAAKVYGILHRFPVSKDQVSRLLGIDIRSTTKYMAGLEIWFRYGKGHYYKLGEVLPHVIAAQKGSAGNALERKNDAQARKTELEIAQIEGDLINIDLVEDLIGTALGGYAKIVNASDVPKSVKEDISKSYNEILKKWNKKHGVKATE